MSSSIALRYIAQAYSFHNLEEILMMSDCWVFGFIPVIALTEPKNLDYYVRAKKEPLQILVDGKQKATFLFGCLVANDYIPENFSLSSYLSGQKQTDTEEPLVFSKPGLHIQVYERDQLPIPPPINLEEITLPTEKIYGENFLIRRISWLLKDEEHLTPEDHDLIQKYKEADFVTFVRKPEEISDSRQATAAVGASSHPAAGSVLRIRPMLNALSPHAGMLREEQQSVFTSLIQAAANASVSLPVPSHTVRRQKAAPSSSDGSTPEARARTRTDSELSDYHDCVPPASIPRIFFGSRESTTSSTFSETE